jgi:SAM-dependent methyltransferase
MTYSVLAPQGLEVVKTRWRAVPYTGGKGLDLGCGKEKLFDTEFCTGIDNGKDAELFGSVINANIKQDVTDLSQFASGKQDYVFSSHVLEHIPYSHITATLREWLRVLKIDGYLILYLPDDKQYPLCAEPDQGIKGDPSANQDHKWNVNYDRLVAAMARTAFNWDLVHYEVCDKDDEYSLFFVFRRLR